MKDGWKVCHHGGSTWRLHGGQIRCRSKGKYSQGWRSGKGQSQGLVSGCGGEKLEWIWKNQIMNFFIKRRTIYFIMPAGIFLIVKKCAINNYSRPTSMTGTISGTLGLSQVNWGICTPAIKACTSFPYICGNKPQVEITKALLGSESGACLDMVCSKFQFSLSQLPTDTHMIWHLFCAIFPVWEC